MKSLIAGRPGAFRQGLAALLLAVCMTACADRSPDDSVSDSLSVVGPEAQADTANAYGATPDEQSQNENTVRVRLDSYRIDMPTTLPAGPTRFEIVNVNKEADHSFALAGPGGEVRLEAAVSGDELQQLRADLRPGTYRAYCPLDDHAGKGMELQVTVTEQGVAARDSVAAR